MRLKNSIKIRSLLIIIKNYKYAVLTVPGLKVEREVEMRWLVSGFIWLVYCERKNSTIIYFPTVHKQFMSFQLNS